MATTLYEVDPISRIEGHLGVKVSVDSVTGKITEANAHGNLWRGFENFLIGRQVNDAITFTQRICGVCPVPHGLTSTYAADSVMGVSNGYLTFAQVGGTGDGVPPAAVLVRNMILAAEFLMSSITHFYHLAAQSYVQGPAIPPWTPFFDDAQYHALLKNPGGTSAIPDMSGPSGTPANLWSAVILQYVKALRIRRLCLEAGALFAGRMPMTSAYIAGGTTNTFRDQADFDRKCDQFRDLIAEVGKFVITEYIPLTLALGALYPDWDNTSNTNPAAIGGVTGKGYGKGVGNFLAWGGFPETNAAGTLNLKGGVKIGAGAVTDLLVNRANLSTAKGLVEANLKEFISRSRYANTNGYSTGVDSAYPGNVTATEPKRDLASKYSWMKAPRWNGQPMEVGPFARMVINGKYPIDGTKVVTPYASIYVAAGELDYTNPNVVDANLVAGLNHAQGGFTTGQVLLAVKAWIEGLNGGLSTMDRLRARAIESYWMVKYLIGDYDKATGLFTAGNGWVDELQGLWSGTDATAAGAPKFYRDTTPPPAKVSGYGLTEAPRGALGHFVTASGGKIVSYQCVVPTTWNGSPKDGPDSGLGADPKVNDGATKRGPMEQSMIDVPFSATAVVAVPGAGDRLSGVEVLRVAQSFDPCIACAVH